VRVDGGETDVHPVVTEVGLSRQGELLRLRFDKRIAPVLGEREAHDRSIAREGQIDDSADSELHAAAHKRLAAARKRDRKRPNLFDRHHGSSAIRIRGLSPSLH